MVSLFRIIPIKNKNTRALSGFFYGALNDRFSRKLTLILPMVGHFIEKVILLFSAIYIHNHMAWLVFGGFIGEFFLPLFSPSCPPHPLPSHTSPYPYPLSLFYIETDITFQFYLSNLSV